MKYWISSVQCSSSVVSDSLRPHGLQHARLLGPSQTPGVCSNSCLSSWWCHPTITTSVIPFSFHLLSFPASRSFPRSQFFASGHQSIGVPASAWTFCCCSVDQLCPTLCNPMDCSMLSLPVHHQLQEFTQTHDSWVDDAIQPSHPRSSPSPAFSLSQHQGLFQWVCSLHQVAKVLQFQLQHQSFQWIFRTDFQ